MRFTHQVTTHHKQPSLDRTLRSPLLHSLPAVATGTAGLLALAAGVFVFAHQRKLLAGYARAEKLAAERQQQLGQAQQALFQSQKMEALGTLAAGVAHDFNNLLSIIRMSNQLVDRAVKPEGVTKENLEAIEQAVQQGKSLVNSMLGYSRRPADTIEDFAVAKVVGDTVALLSRQFLGGLTLNLQLDQFCPPIHGSRARLEQVLLNLIVNASEAMKGSGALAITARPVEFPVPPQEGRASTQPSFGRRRAFRERHRARHRTGRVAAHLRTLLHHEERWHPARHGTRPLTRLCHRQARRLGAGCAGSAGRRHHVHAASARQPDGVAWAPLAHFTSRGYLDQTERHLTGL